MRRFAVVLYILVVVVIGLFAYTEYLDNNRVSVTSAIVGIKPRILNNDYLSQKLNSIGFWQSNRVALFEPLNIRRVTVKKLVITITNKPQITGSIKANGLSSSITTHSYGQQFNETSGVMTMLLYVDPTYLKKQDPEIQYSGLLLYAAYNFINTTKEQMNDKSKSLTHSGYMADFYSKAQKDPESVKIITIN